MRKSRFPTGWFTRARRVFGLFIFLWVVLSFPLVCGAQEAPTTTDPVTTGLALISEITPSDPGDFTFAVFGDNRGSTTVFETLLGQINDDPDILFAISLGDIVGVGTQARFDFFFSQVNRCLRKPLVFAVGNHELMGGGRDLYTTAVGRLNYSFAFGDAYFIIIDDTGPSGIDPAFEEWLKGELTAAGGYGKTFVFMHVPLYNPAGTDIRHSLSPGPARRLMDILSRYRVTHIFCSHIHGYYSGDWEGIPYTISGGAGAPLVGTDPQHYFFNYLRVHVKGASVTIEVVPVNGHPQ